MRKITLYVKVMFVCLSATFFYQHLNALALLGGFAKLRKATVSFVMSITVLLNLSNDLQTTSFYNL